MGYNDIYFKKQHGPCLNCKDHHDGCHSECNAYTDWSQNRSQERDHIHEIKRKQMDNVNYIRDMQLILKRRKK